MAGLARRLLLGIDCGTTATKAVLLDPERGLVAEGSLPMALASPQPGWSEEDPEAWWANVCALVPRLLASAGAGPEHVVAAGVSGAVPCVVCLDARGNPLRPSMQQSDARATLEIDELRERLAGGAVMERTGSAITQQSVGPKLRWLRRHEPEVIDRTAAVCGSYDFITRRLTGAVSTEANWALESGLFDLMTETWAADICAACGVELPWLGPVRRPSEVVGMVVGRGLESGLRAGTPVIAGSADHVASAFSAGVVAEGDALVKLGGSADLLIASAHPLIDPRLYLDYHLIPGRYLPNGCMAASGSALRWFQTVVGGVPLEELDRDAEAAGIGAGGLVALPYLLGEKTPLNDPLARGVFAGLHLGHERGHLFRALLEGIAFGLRHHVEILTERGLTPRRVRVTNGGSRSRLWRRIVADVLGLPLESLVSHPGSSLGAAFAAGMGVHAFADWQEIEQFVTVDERIEPVPAARQRYDALYAIYRGLYPATRSAQHALAHFGAASPPPRPESPGAILSRTHTDTGVHNNEGGG